MEESRDGRDVDAPRLAVGAPSSPSEDAPRLTLGASSLPPEDAPLVDGASHPSTDARNLRIRVVTWNVGGVTPGSADLTPLVFGEAKDSNRPNATPDIFVFSFQELATLDSAMNNFVASLTTGGG